LTAYPKDFIISLRLESKEELAFFHPLLTISSNIEHLDLSNSNLQSCLKEFDLNLMEILRASSKTLKSLNLSGNCLDSDFLKKFTLPQRLSLVNFENLNRINLSYNHNLCLSNELMCNIKKFESLSELILSKCQHKDHSKTYFNGFSICSCDTNLTKKLHCQNSGWISKLTIKDLILNETKNALNSSEGILILVDL